MLISIKEIQMPEQNNNANVVHSQNLAVLAAAANLGVNVMLKTIGGEHSAATLENEFLTEETIRDAIVARMVKFLG